ncbi:methyltransferase domain-containing protein [Haloarcula sp. S1CR25-12]|uniref:Methyltransferase domain-containing protein n=1 Tax=Haloarcula saliterrae TaxID=2950534 RepID=A0ABU2FFE9_9EURY|nr:methyltransferase domain-containing protein [Haloarcula sp. S1CR25-12]MDS0260962.1 methyltransferase domain-containing protein [Haloarcula sp. S1CR25-12]
MSSSDLAVGEVESHYTDMIGQFKQVWSMSGHKSIHAGYHDDHPDSEESAARNMIRELAETAEVDSTDRVLNIGCGAGDAAVWLVRERDAEVVGVDICEPLLDEAREHAFEFEADDQTSFVQDDFHELSSIDEEFDVVWGLESIEHSSDLETAVETVRRVLKDDGVAVFADNFISTSERSGRDQKRIETMNDRLRYNLTEIETIKEELTAGGFSDVEVRDISEYVLPSIKSQYRLSVATLPWYKLMTPLGIANRPKSDLVHGSYHSYKLFKKDVLGYYIVRASA